MYTFAGVKLQSHLSELQSGNTSGMPCSLFAEQTLCLNIVSASPLLATACCVKKACGAHEVWVKLPCEPLHCQGLQHFVSCQWSVLSAHQGLLAAEQPTCKHSVRHSSA